MTVLDPWRTRRRTDALISTVILVAAIGTGVITTWIAFRSWDRLVLFALHPLRLQEVHALWTGLLSANLLVLQIVFMARLPWLERHWGRRVIMRRHRRLGWWSFWLMIAHVALFVLQRTLRDPDAVGQALGGLFVTEAWMLPATIGTALLIMVVATSIARARRRLRYERWHLIHLWAYLGLGLTLPHQLVSRDFGAGWPTAYWWALYLIALGAVITFRVAVPLHRSVRHRLQVVEVRHEDPRTVSVIMTGRWLDRLRPRSGQFFVWRFLGSHGWTRGHPYSLSEAPTADRLRVTVDTTGDGGRRAAGLTPGARVLIEGPYGAVITDRRRHDRMVLLAAGVGITPFRALLDDLPLRPGEATLVYRVHGDDRVGLVDELTELAHRRGIELVVLPGPRRAPGSWLPRGENGDDVAVLETLVPDVAARDVLLCGPDGWVTAVRHAALQAGVAARDLHTEEFSW